MTTENTGKTTSGNDRKCPKCGATMVLRTAQRGPNTGSKFYGCPKYPHCKGAVEPEAGRDEWVLPVELKARGRFEGYDTLFFQNMAVPKQLLDAVNREEISREKLCRFGQWRLDFPEAPAPKVILPEGIKKVLLIARKILTRGRVTLLSPSLEEKLRHLFPFEKFEAADIDLNVYLALAAQNEETTAWFDGAPNPALGGLTHEHYFYERLLPQSLGPYYRRFVLPQVHFSSLVSDVAYQQVDFLITLPTKSIVVEIDGPEHDEEPQKSHDKHRDSILQTNGYWCIRVKNREVADGAGPKLQELQKAIGQDKTEPVSSLSAMSKYLLAVKHAHQAQVVVIEAMLAGFAPMTSEQVEICFDTSSVSFLKGEAGMIVASALEDLDDLLSHLFDLYAVEASFAEFEPKILDGSGAASGPVITFNENLMVNGPRFVIQDISFPGIIAHDEKPSIPARVPHASEDTLRYFLKYIFRYDTFLEGQFEAITRASQGEDAVVLLPTGGGKSLAFQLASLLLPGVCIVISPIIALIDDQKENLERIGIDRVVGITSQFKGPIRSKLIEAFGNGEYILCYISPERMQIDQFRSYVAELVARGIPISVIAIDEAHCVSEWGHDFRTSYLNIGRTAREYAKAGARTPPLLALTGTASHAVLRDVQRELQITDFDAVVTPKTFDRKELHFAVQKCRSDRKSGILRAILQSTLPETFCTTARHFYTPCGDKTNCGIVFCPHVNGQYGVTRNHQYISSKLGVSAELYCGDEPKGFTGDFVRKKRKNASDFKNNKFPLLVATKAFGMGIDKPNIRYTVHLGLPGSIESFYQQAGRAGRDRKAAQSILMLSNDLRARTSALLDPGATTEELNRITTEAHDGKTDDDVTRAVWFHLNSFRGIEKELDDIDNIMREIGDVATAKRTNVACPVRDQNDSQDRERNNREKAVYRLLLLGVIEDYTIDYAGKEFRLELGGISKERVVDRFCKYVEGYNRGRVASEKEKLIQHILLPLAKFVRCAAEVLIDFIYDTIEKGRRRAFRELLSMAEEAVEADDQDTCIRERILRYLETTYLEEIQEVLKEEGSFRKLKMIFDGGVILEAGEMIGGVRSQGDAAQIRGQVARYLESYPDHPGLLFLRALSEIYCSKSDVEAALGDIKAGRKSALEKYKIPISSLYEVLSWLLVKVYSRSSSLCEDYVARLIEDIDDPDFGRTLMNYPDMDENMLYGLALCSTGNLARKAVNILNS